MPNNQRRRQRIACELNISYEFAKWDEDYLGPLENPHLSHSRDLSISGINMSFGKELTNHVLQQLLAGTRKIRLGIQLPGQSEPVVLFAAVVWSSQGGMMVLDREHCGCTFLNPPEFKTYILKTFIEQNSKSELDQGGTS